MKDKTITIIGELMNNSYGRARKAWAARSISGYQNLAKLQTELGANTLTLNMDSTQKLAVTLDEMIEFLPEVVPAIQEVTRAPISFDNPDIRFHRKALEVYDRSKVDGRPILNSVAVSRHHVEEMCDMVAEHDMNVIVMVSECIKDGGHKPSTTVDDILSTTKHFVDILRARGVENDRIIIDPGLAPIASETTGLINLGLDAIAAIHTDPDLLGVHTSVGLSNFAIGGPAALRVPQERAYLRIAMDLGLDWVLANPEKNTTPLEADDELVKGIQTVLEEGRPQAGDSNEDAGFRQLDELMELWEDVA